MEGGLFQKTHLDNAKHASSGNSLVIFDFNKLIEKERIPIDFERSSPSGSIGRRR